MLARQTELQKNEPRLRVLAAAVEEFARHGLANARVRSIVDAARVNLAAVNYYFGGKEGLYHATLLSLAVRLAPLDVAKVESAATPRERLDACLAVIVGRLATSSGPHALARILAHEALSRSSRFGVVLEEVLPGELSLLRGALGDLAGGDSGEIATSLAAERILGQCVLYLHGALSWDFESRQHLVRQIAESAARQSLRTQRAARVGAEK